VLGKCAARPTDCSGQSTGIVCGCNGITYLNSCLAHADGASVDPTSTGGNACGKGTAVTCTQADDPACTQEPDGSARAGGKCGMLGATTDVNYCAAPTGVCWVVPSVCPSQDVKGAASCTDTSDCGSVCTAVTAQTPFRRGTCAKVTP
jgi:hypothetical protein